VAGPLLAVDAPSMLFRAFYALPASIKTPEGMPVNALLGTANMVLTEIERHDPRAVVLCFGPDAATYRLELYPPYHSDREELPDELAPQWSDAEDFFGAFGWSVVGHETLEADDLLGTYARLEAAAKGRALLLTGDRDMFQCVTDRVSVLYPQRGVRGMSEITPDEVRSRYGIPPELVPDFIALRGDPSDGIPGAKGIGEKTAAELLRRHGSLEAVLEAAVGETRVRIRTALMGQRDELLAFKRVATLQDAGVKRPRDRATDRAGGAKAARARGMNRLAARLEGAAA
jgi:DNA polymerase-1